MSVAHLVLASSSPRRSQLLSQVGLDFDVIPSSCEEGMIHAQSPDELVKRLAHAKASDVAERLRGRGRSCIVVGADTIVVVDDDVLGKPADQARAREMLRRLSGREHQVYSGVSVVDSATGRSLTDYEMTRVRFRALSDAAIERYVATGEPMDKAGAYGIQGVGSLLVEGITGDFFCVMGLPIGLVASMLSEFGIRVL